MSPDHNADWLHRNDMYQRETICRSSEDQDSNMDEESVPHGPSTLSIREPSSPTIEISSEEDDEPCCLPSLFSYPAQSFVTGILQGESSTGTSQIIDCGNAANNNKISHEICLLKHDVPFLFCSSYCIYTCAATTSTIIQKNPSWYNS